MKIDDIKDKIDMMETTIYLLDFKIKHNHGYYQADNISSNSYIIFTDLIYEIGFDVSKDGEIKHAYLLMLDYYDDDDEPVWADVKIIDYPSEEEVDEVIGCLIAKIGVE